MSDPYNHGHHPAQQFNSQPHTPFPQQSNQSASTNSLPAHYAAFTNYATVNNSYQYNASIIPGLGLNNSRSAPHHITTQPKETSKQTNPATVSKQGGLAMSSQGQSNHSLEEGELSEGEFEDLYEPVINEPAPSSPQPASTRGNQNGSVGDADGSSIYDGATPQGEAAMNSATTSQPVAEREYSPGEDWEPTYQERERSGSYSPYLSPREIQRKMSVSKPSSYGTKQGPDTRPSQSLPGINPSLVQQPTATAPLSNGTYPSTITNGHSITPIAAKDSTAPSQFQSVAEAKKKAQEAILGLWPLKVRYQHYIEEGFDKNLIKGLFADLGLEASMPKPTGVQKSRGDSEVPVASEPSKAIPEESQNMTNQPSPKPKPQQPTTIIESTEKAGIVGDTKTAEKTAAEERKDKIARKLAAKAQKTVAIRQHSAPAPPSQLASAAPVNVSVATPTNAPPTKAKTRAENNAILHQKLAALKKAQEEKAMAEKLATESSVKSGITPIVPTNIPGKSPGSKSREESSFNTPAVPMPPPDPNRRSVSTEKSLPKEGVIPGLFLVTQPSQTTNRNLKRPVASDFDSYSTPTGTLKRTRTQEPLIIDVSDDEDVEMDIGSPIDEPASSNEITNQPSQQTPLGTFPPLSDSLNQGQRSSPSSTAFPTPPAHGVKLSLLNKRIEEAKRRIAEVEAKKAAKRAIVPQSPQAQRSATESTVQPPRIDEVSQILQRAKSGDFERRDRIVSFELPTVEAVLREKEEKLKQAVAQAAQLELEIQARIEERRRLTMEMEELADSPGPMAVEMNMQAQLVPSGVVMTPDSNQVIESQLQNGYQSSSGQAGDMSVTEGEDTSQSHQGTALNEASPGSALSHPLVDGQPLANVQSAKDLMSAEELPAEAGNDNTPPKSTSTNVFIEDPTEPNNAVNVMNLQSEEQDEDMADVPEHLSRYPPSHGVLLTGPGNNNSARSHSPEEPRNLFDDKQTTVEILNGAGTNRPAEDLTLSAMPNPSGEVQNSSSREHPLLTTIQDAPEQKPQLEDPLSYHSPLGYFRAFRFHPRYFDEVAGGLKSMTYSSKIDPMQPICPLALLGEQCPDGDACEYQHFENMVLPDAEIITQLGSADMFTGETRNKFIEGLKKVLNGLKANRVKDFDRITRAIVKHRQEFLEDKSKVLPLDAGTS
ncbi:hypothetical protein F4804DRAFT_315728 [Jackrogersella minutella]|nr:hypothetical protein F4804DRAFT_315728 [Jackrogersella minutella]